MSADVLGGLAALASALLFTIAAVLFQRVSVAMDAWAINLVKGVVALIMLLPVVLRNDFTAVDGKPFLLLATSGLLGITAGDTAYFLALRHLGARRTLLLDTLAPGLTVATAALVLHEVLAPLRGVGIMLTLFGVGWVMLERGGAHGETSTATWRGWAYGLTHVGCFSASIILSKLALASIPAYASTFVRQGCATAALLLFSASGRRLGPWLLPLKDRRRLFQMIAASSIGTFLGTWMALKALSLTQASLATTLNATSPLFILVMARYVLHERVSLRAVMGAVVAVAGVVLLLAV